MTTLLSISRSDYAKNKELFEFFERNTGFPSFFNKYFKRGYALSQISIVCLNLNHLVSIRGIVLGVTYDADRGDYPL